MEYEVTVEYTEKLVKTATRRFLVKFLGWDFLAAWSVLLAALITLVCLGKRDWFVGAIGAVLGLSALLALIVWIVFHRRALSTLRKMQNPKAIFVFDDEGIAVTSDLSSGKVMWPAVEKLWCFPEAWLLFFTKGAYSTLPTAYLSNEVKDLIIRKLKQQGVKIS